MLWVALYCVNKHFLSYYCLAVARVVSCSLTCCTTFVPAIVPYKARDTLKLASRFRLARGRVHAVWVEDGRRQHCLTTSCDHVGWKSRMRRKRLQTFGSLVCPPGERLVRCWRYELQQIQIHIQSDLEWADSVQDSVPDQQTIFDYDNASREVDLAIADETNFSSTIAAGRCVDVDNVLPRPPPVLPHRTTTLPSTTRSLAVEL